jgi:nucleoside-diphosphate-sugar epimerase
LFTDVDAIVHCAFIRRPERNDSEDVNVRGSILLAESARERGVEQFVFLSSLAAHSGALSRYGKEKFALERRFESDGSLVIRPGLVLGAGGIFGAMTAYLRTHRFVPLVDGGQQPLQTVHVDDLVAAIDRGLESRLTGTFTVAESSHVPYVAFYRELSAALGSQTAFVRVPSIVLVAGIKTALLLRIPIPIDLDNVLGLKAMHEDSGRRLSDPLHPIRDYKRNIEKAISGC